jgi:transposase
MHTWTEAGHPLRLQEFEDDEHDPDPKALCCYGLLRGDTHSMWLRFIEGRPVSAVTIAYLEWVCERLAVEGKRVLVLIWDNAGWHISHQVRNWLGEHNRRALADRREGKAGVQIIPCFLPTKSPWLNNIEPKWVHGKRAVAEPDRKLTAHELTERICAYFDCDHLDHLKQYVS